MAESRALRILQRIIGKKTLSLPKEIKSAKEKKNKQIDTIIKFGKGKQ